VAISDVLCHEARSGTQLVESLALVPTLVGEWGELIGIGELVADDNSGDSISSVCSRPHLLLNSESLKHKQTKKAR
jgi:hypothetical protein